MLLKNKTILITGASTGIGKELAIRLASGNNNLILISRRIELLEDIKNSVSANHSMVDVLACDVSEKAQVAAAFKQIFAKHASIDIAILNSGVSYRQGIENFDSSIAEKTIAVNLLGLIFCIEQLLPSFMKNGYGIIAGVSSLAESRGFAKSGIYCASKAAVSIYLESLRSELHQFGIKVITIKPGFVRTPMTDKNEFNMPLLMDVKDAVDIIMNGLEKGKTIIQFPKPMVIAVKILKLLPNIVFDFISRNQLKFTGQRK